MVVVYRRILQLCIFVSLLAIGTWIRALAPSYEIPPPSDATTALVVAKQVENLQTEHWRGVKLPQETFRHHLLAVSAKGVSPEVSPYRDYTFLPLFLSVLFLPLVPCLGWKKHGGVFHTSDGPLWALAFTTVLPVAFMGATSLTPFTFQCVVFLLLLLAARSYALWPSMLPAISMGLIMAGAVTVSAEVAWVLILFFLVTLFGVGWTRITLYWRTSHVVIMVISMFLGLAVAFFFGWLSAPQLPKINLCIETMWVHLKHQITWLCVYGVGLFAWGGVVAIARFQKESRWERMIAIFFPIAFLFGIVFEGEVGIAFAIPLAVLTPIMVALVLTRCPKGVWRWWMGNVILIGLCIGFLAAMKQAPSPLKMGTIPTCIKEDLHPLPLAETGVDLALVHVHDQQHVAQLLWLLRSYASGRKVIVTNMDWKDAQVVVVPMNSPEISKSFEIAETHTFQWVLSLGISGEAVYGVYIKNGD